MNYYPFHLGDYAAHTAHLEPIEDLAYRRMLDAYYLREGPLPAEPTEVARIIRLRSHLPEVESVLREFFTNAADGLWYHARCDVEIDRMQDKQAKARASAAASVNARRTKAERPLNDGTANAERTLNERSTDVELPTPTPTPTPISSTDVEETPRKRAAVLPRPDDVSEQTWADFIAQRKAHKAPLTQTALDQIAAEARKACIPLENALQICCARGWRGFRADWLNEARGNAPAARPQAQSFRERDKELAMTKYEEIFGKPHPDRAPAPTIIDVTPTQTLLDAS
jgi:uncharacterized protein YdaU (DUF1376 family)